MDFPFNTQILHINTFCSRVRWFQTVLPERAASPPPSLHLLTCFSFCVLVSSCFSSPLAAVLGSCSSPVSSQVGQGCATALALLFDKDQSVKFVLDRDLVEGGHEMIFFHPMTNAASMGLRPDDLLRFLKETGHEPILESFE